MSDHLFPTPQAEAGATQPAPAKSAPRMQRPSRDQTLFALAHNVMRAARNRPQDGSVRPAAMVELVSAGA